jgi:alpha-beta hydrolase superfamily lysophospholipase
VSVASPSELAVVANEVIRIIMKDGVEIAMRVITPAVSADVTAVVLHGNGLHGGYYVPLARLLAVSGIRLVLIDQRGHGMSAGQRGHIDMPTQYADDVAACIEALSVRFAGPLFVLAHSAGAAILLKASKLIDWSKLAGIALLAPTFASEGVMVRRRAGNSFTAGKLLYMLRTRTPRAVESDSNNNRMEFSAGMFLLSKVFGIGKRWPVLTYIPSLAGEQPYTYTAAGLEGSMVGRPEPHLARVAVPVFLATGDKDIFVNDASIHSIVPWGLRPEVPLTSMICVGGDHFTMLLHAVRPLAAWISVCSARRTA